MLHENDVSGLKKKIRAKPFSKKTEMDVKNQKQKSKNRGENQKRDQKRNDNRKGMITEKE